MNIKDSLLRRAQELHIAMPKLMQHYAMERFLYRLSLSPYAEKFYLKGGMLLMGMGAGAARTTMDIDLLGRIANSPESVLKAVRGIIRTKPGVADGVHFSDDIRAEEITKDARYVGLRVLFAADVAGMACTMKIDIGFSDEIYPKAMELDYPATLSELPSARLLCYSAESMVAEKWQAMVQLKEMNSRMKDFYDLWFLSRTRSFNYPTLKEAIARTFARRETNPAEYAYLATAKYLAAQQPDWAAYVRKLKAATFQKKSAVEIPSRDLSEVMAEILRWLEPVMQDEEHRSWQTTKGWN